MCLVDETTASSTHETVEGRVGTVSANESKHGEGNVAAEVSGEHRNLFCCETYFCSAAIGITIRIDSVMRPQSSSRMRNTSASVTVTVTVNTFSNCISSGHCHLLP